MTALADATVDASTPSAADLDLRSLLGIPFTDEQLAAITAPLRPTLVVAGAGSGKTSVMAARVVWLVATGQVRPDQVLGLTFTNKAAGELAGRVRSALATLGRRVAADDDDPGEPTVATYHAYAGRLLTEHGLRLGLEPGARLLSEAARFQLAQRVVRRARGPFTALTRAVSTVVDDVLALDAELSEHLVAPETLRSHDEALVAELAAAPSSTKKVRRVAEVACGRLELLTLVEEFRRAKAAAEAVDFGDQVAYAARLAEECPPVGDGERARFSVVLLDEYQDTSVAQRRMLVGLFGGHQVTAVGDPCQAIYGWRGASVGNLDGFPRHFADGDGPAAVHRLAVNQRSGGVLLRLANRVAEPLRALHPTVAPLVARLSTADLGVVRATLQPTWADEVAWVAEGIAAEVAGGRRPGECAVLTRVRSALPDLHDALLARGLPVEVVGLGGLLTLPEVADLVAVLQVLHEPTANASMMRLLTGPRWRLGVRDLAALGRIAAALGRPVGEPAGEAATADPALALARAVSGADPTEVVALCDAVDEAARHRGELSAEAVERLTALSRELRGLRRHVGEPLVELIHRVLDTTGLGVELAASPSAVAAGRAEAVAAFLDHAARFAGLDGEATLGAFLAYLRAADAVDDGLDHDPAGPSGRDAVQLMTVHRAKGLEWDVVAVPSLSAGVFPSERGRPSWLTSVQVLPYPLRGDAADLPAVDEWTGKGLDHFGEAAREHARQEERRLAYVALTRARHVLLTSGHWWGPTQKNPRGPSEFLDTVQAHSRDGYGLVDAWAEPPDDGETNPRLGETAEVAWPAPLAAEARALRVQAATAVREELARLAAGRPSDPDEGLDMVDASITHAWDADIAALLAEARRTEGDQRVVPLPASLTASQLVRLAADPAGLARDLARPLPHPPAVQARRGSAFHAWVEQRYGVRALIDRDEVPGAGDADLGDEPELAALQEAFLAGPYADRPPVAIEAPFALTIAGRVIRGRIDAVYDDSAGGYEVVDWKTGREAADPLQLAVYRVAWAELAGVPVERVRAAFVYVREGSVVHPECLPDRQGLAALLGG